MAKDKEIFYVLEIVTGNVRVHFENPERYTKGGNEVFPLLPQNRGSNEYLRVVLLDKTIAVGEGKRLVAKPFDSLAWVTREEARDSDKTVSQKLENI